MTDNSQMDNDDAAVLMKRALGGYRGFIATAVPSLAFVVVWVITNDLNLSLIVSLVAAGISAIIQIILRDTLQHVINGLIGIVYFIAQLIRKAILGFVVGGILGDLTSWLKDPKKVQAAWIAGWFWVGLFALRMAIQTPLYLAEQVAALGIARVAMGWPGFLLVSALSYKVMKPAFSRRAQ